MSEEKRLHSGATALHRRAGEDPGLVWGVGKPYNRSRRLGDTSVAGTDGALLSVHMDTPLRILAVDNEPTITFSLKYVFAGPRYEFTSAESGDAALANLEANPDPYDVIIVDQKMPNLTGVELVGAIRKRGINGKIIVLSAHLSSKVREDYAGMDVHEMLAKPFDVEELRSAVNRLAA